MRWFESQTIECVHCRKQAQAILVVPNHGVATFAIPPGWLFSEALYEARLVCSRACAAAFDIAHHCGKTEIVT